MEEDKLKKIFDDYDPKLTSDSAFLLRLRRNMDSVEIVRQKNMELRKESRKAVMFAGGAGFVAGIVFALLLPGILEIVTRLFSMLPDNIRIGTNETASLTTSWMLIGILILFITYQAYELSLSYFSSRRRESR